MSFQTTASPPPPEPTSNDTQSPFANPAVATLPLAPIRKIVFLRADSIGDGVLSAAMIPAIARHYPGATLTVLCANAVAPIFETCPHVSQIIQFDKERARQDSRYRDGLITKLQELNADVLLNAVYSRDALCDFLAYHSGARQRIAHCGDLSNIEPAQRQTNNRFYHRLLPSPGAWKLENKRNEDFLQGLGIDAGELEPTLWLSSQDHDAASQVLAQNNLIPSKTMVLFASAQFDIRTYPHFGQALSTVCREQDLAIVAIGSSAESALNQQALSQAGAPCVNLCGKTTLRQSAAIIQASRLTVGVESGSAHIACAVGKPNVVLLGGGHFGRFMPYSPLTSIVCNPLSCYGCNWRCKHARPHCVKDVAPEVIEVAIRETLQGCSDNPRIYMQHWAFAPPPPATEPFFNVDLLPPMLLDVACVLPQDAPQIANPAPAMLGRPMRYIRTPRQKPTPTLSSVNVQGLTRTGSAFVSFNRKT
jgi:ADP-heptose:LPS heptosyltransferase